MKAAGQIDGPALTKGFFKDDIVFYENFIIPEHCERLVEYFKSKENWARVAFYNSWGDNLREDDIDIESFGFPRDYLREVAENMHKYVEDAHGVKVKRVSTHVQRWDTGAYATFHSDNSDLDGNPSAWEVSKFVCLIYLNDDYEGGELNFRDHDICIKPSVGMMITFPGGIKNVHEVKVVDSGTRYTIGSFWDNIDAEYSDERKAEWEEERSRVKNQQEKMYEEWDRGNVDYS